MKTATKESFETRQQPNKAHKMSLAKMKTRVGSLHPWINLALFRALSIGIKPVPHQSAATFLMALPGCLLVRVCVCLYPCALSALIPVRAAAGEHCQQQYSSISS